MLFRIIWGFAGSSTARFGHFVKGPRAAWQYVRPTGGAPQPPPLGHNPLGGWSVLELLGLLALQIVTELFAVDLDELESGPLSYLVDFDRGRIAAEIHEVSFNVLLTVSAFYVAVILLYLAFKRSNLIAAMRSGYQRDTGSGGTMVCAPWSHLVAVIEVALAIAFAVSTGLRF